MSLIPAFKKNESLLQEIDSLSKDESQFHVWWLGQSGFILQWKGQRVVMDPYLSDSLTKKYASTDKPHTRMSEMVIDPARLKDISILSSSHNHTDHLDADTIIPILKNNPDIKFVVPEANRKFVAERAKIDASFLSGVKDGQTLQLGMFSFYGMPAKHDEIERDENNNCLYMGYVIGFGKYKIYHSGDTLWFDEMVDLLKPLAIDVAILPINGNVPERRVQGNLDCREAAALGKAIGAKTVIPCHYDMFDFNSADVGDFIKEAKKINQPFTVLRGGERYSSN
jgi:L-ascorbate metabolism protein UlaG (beta-lactamase superfamily)